MLFHPETASPTEKQRIINAAQDEIDNLLHVVATAYENYEGADENQNISTIEFTTAIIELTKLQSLINHTARAGQ